MAEQTGGSWLRRMTVTEAHWFVFALSTSGLALLTTAGVVVLVIAGERDTALAAMAAAFGIWFAGLIVCLIETMLPSSWDDIDDMKRSRRSR